MSDENVVELNRGTVVESTPSLSDLVKRESAVPPLPGPFDRNVLEAEYRQVASEYGDAQNRLRTLQKYLRDTETRLDHYEALFGRLAASERGAAK